VTRVRRFPDPTDPELVASVDVALPDPAHETRAGADADLAVLAPELRRRHTNRRRFGSEQVPESILRPLGAIAADEGASLVHIVSDADRALVAELTTRADRAQLLDPKYRAELRAWTSDDPLRRDGVSAVTVPRVGDPSGDDVPIRDFDTRGSGGLPTRTDSSRNQTLVLLCTSEDAELAWLHAGEALERVWLELSAAGWTASPFTQAVEVPAARLQLRRGLGLGQYPHLLLRIGRAGPTPGSPRRHLTEVLLTY
jgi:hypothetical protein